MRIANRINRFNGLANFLFYQAVIHEDDPFYLEPSLTRCTVASTAFSKIPLEKNSHNHDFEYIKNSRFGGLVFDGGEHDPTVVLDLVLLVEWSEAIMEISQNESSP